MAKWLVIYTSKDNEPKAKIVNDPSGQTMPFGVALDRLGIDDAKSAVVIVELEQTDRPLVVDHSTDEELGVEFIDL